MSGEQSENAVLFSEMISRTRDLEECAKFNRGFEVDKIARKRGRDGVNAFSFTSYMYSLKVLKSILIPISRNLDKMVACC